jgi:hypothetical protein
MAGAKKTDTSQTVCRVLVDQVGAFAKGETFIAEETGYEVSRLLAQGAIEIVSGITPNAEAAAAAVPVSDPEREFFVGELSKVETFLLGALKHIGITPHVDASPSELAETVNEAVTSAPVSTPGTPLGTDAPKV